MIGVLLDHWHRITGVGHLWEHDQLAPASFAGRKNRELWKESPLDRRAKHEIRAKVTFIETSFGAKRRLSDHSSPEVTTTARDVPLRST